MASPVAFSRRLLSSRLSLASGTATGTGSGSGSAFRPATLTALPIAGFSTSSMRSATPYGPPQPNFRPQPAKQWDEGESSIDKATKYFLMSEIFRGMYVVLEQFFRPPYVYLPCHSLFACVCHFIEQLLMRFQFSCDNVDTQSTTPSKRALSLHVSVASMLSAATQQVKSVVLPASFARPSALPRLSPLKPKREWTAPGGQPDTIST